MQIVYHIGAHCTDGEKLLRSLMKNTGSLAERGIKVPGPGKYRRLLRETIQGLNGAAPAPDTRAVLLDAILDDGLAERMVLSNAAFICTANRVFEGGEFYALAAMKVESLAALFPGDTLELHMALRNPATFIPAVWAQAKGRHFGVFLGNRDPRDYRWSDVIARIRAAAPAAQLTLWCNEDTPLIWGAVLRRLAGLEPGAEVAGEYDLLASIMSPEGMTRFGAYLRTHPPQTETQKGRVIAAFLDKYALADEIEEEVDLPGWDAAMVDELGALYDADVARIAAMDGVSFVAP